MTVRVVELSRAVMRIARRLLPPGSALRHEFVLTLHDLEKDTLPGRGDMETLLPPGNQRIWFRRVLLQNLWITFSFDDTHVRVRGLSPAPPIPADEPPSDPEPEAAE